MINSTFFWNSLLQTNKNNGKCWKKNQKFKSNTFVATNLLAPNLIISVCLFCYSRASWAFEGLHGRHSVQRDSGNRTSAHSQRVRSNSRHLGLHAGISSIPTIRSEFRGGRGIHRHTQAYTEDRIEVRERKWENNTVPAQNDI